MRVGRPGPETFGPVAPPVCRVVWDLEGWSQSLRRFRDLKVWVLADLGVYGVWDLEMERFVRFIHL